MEEGLRSKVSFKTEHYFLYQSASKMLHSTKTALLRVKHDIAGALDRNHAMMFVMLDLSAAFDTINHAHLLKLLQDEYGVRGTALAWFRTYMEDRTYRVQIDSTIFRAYFSIVWCTTGLGPWASYIYSLHHANAAHIQKTWSTLSQICR